MSMTNTYVSPVGGPTGGGSPQAAVTQAPGASGPGGSMPTAAAVGWLIALSAAIGIGTAYIGRKGAKPMIGHLDVFETVYNASTLLVVFGTLKVVAYRYHGHAVSQAILLVL